MRFHGVVAKYLENYPGWQRGLERWGNANSPQMALDAALGREKAFSTIDINAHVALEKHT